MVAKARALFLALLLAGVGVSALGGAPGPVPVGTAFAQSRDAGGNQGSGDHNGGKNYQRGGDHQGGDRQRDS